MGRFCKIEPVNLFIDRKRGFAHIDRYHHGTGLHYPHQFLNAPAQVREVSESPQPIVAPSNELSSKDKFKASPCSSLTFSLPRALARFFQLGPASFPKSRYQRPGPRGQRCWQVPWSAFLFHSKHRQFFMPGLA